MRIGEGRKSSGGREAANVGPVAFFATAIGPNSIIIGGVAAQIGELVGRVVCSEDVRTGAWIEVGCGR